jgi:hypothetical protein
LVSLIGSGLLEVPTTTLPKAKLVGEKLTVCAEELGALQMLMIEIIASAKIERVLVMIISMLRKLKLGKAPAECAPSSTASNCRAGSSPALPRNLIDSGP